MSTLRRAREHLAKARETLAKPRPTKQELASLKASLCSWENHVRTEPDDKAEYRCAIWLYGAGCLVGALWELERYRVTDTPYMLEVATDIRYELTGSAGVLDAAERCAAEWEASAVAEDDQPAPVTAHGRIAGLERTATIRHACGCEGTLTLSGCSEGTWREALRTNAAQDCTRHRIEKEQAKLSTIERDLRVKALWE